MYTRVLSDNDIERFRRSPMGESWWCGCSLFVAHRRPTSGWNSMLQTMTDDNWMRSERRELAGERRVCVHAISETALRRSEKEMMRKLGGRHRRRAGHGGGASQAVGCGWGRESEAFSRKDNQYCVTCVQTYIHIYIYIYIYMSSDVLWTRIV